MISARFATLPVFAEPGHHDKFYIYPIPDHTDFDFKHRHICGNYGCIFFQVAMRDLVD